ncbi:MAG: hypothetical protein QXM44_02720 [Candidatus Bathyarchaeia archaeon]
MSVSSSPDYSKYFKYEFIVDEDGSAITRIIYRSNLADGSSWVLIPRFSKWSNYTVHGQVYNWTLEEPEGYTGLQYYFYKVLRFHYFASSGNQFEMVVEYNFTSAAMIIEPDGIFYSPQIGFEGGSGFEATVIFPSIFKVNLNEALALGNRNSYPPDRGASNSSFVLFRNLPLTENLLRIEVGFKVSGRNADFINLESGTFKFITVKRYESYAWKILNLYNSTYDVLANLFNTTLEELDSKGEKTVTVRFFIPDFYSLMSVGGYVPFTGEGMGDIHINFIFTRYVEGYLEVIALHELVHHFLWKAGVSPKKLLWFHEGMAQYVSIEVAERIGYEGASMIKQEIEEGVQQLRAVISDNFGFLMEWTPSYTPRDLNTLYAAAYYVVARLAEEYGGLDYYAKFFSLLGGMKVEDNAALCYYLGLAAGDAGESVINKLNAWGFGTVDLYAYLPLISEVKAAINDVDSTNPLLQPFKYFAELIYKSVMSGERIIAERAALFLLVALLIARFAPLIALLTYSSLIFASILLILRLKGVL